MSVIYCHVCNTHIDTDFDTDHDWNCPGKEFPDETEAEFEARRKLQEAPLWSL